MKVYIDSHGTGKIVRLYFVEEDGMGRASIARIQDGLLVWSPVNEGADDDAPTLKLDGRIAGALFAALAEALSSRGVRTDNDAKLVGTLEATRAHLSDLRALLHIGGPS